MGWAMRRNARMSWCADGLTPLRTRPEPQDPRLRQRLDDRAHPFVWTKTADEILKNANRQTTSTTRY